ncbi:MAG TPA: hypothetical protein VK715_12505 [Steroidobacteraceae bacterium]|jgi:hypothetical protein|nr:hypothetical protein [Steroidobacteraceae bacterium]
MNRRAKVLLGLGLLAAAPACFAQYTLDLTGVGNGTVADGVYVSPYQGTVMQGTSVNFSGYMICDDFNTESYLNTPWNATTTSAGALDGSEKFGTSVMFGGNTYTAQQAYNAAGWLANGLLANLGNTTTQTNYAFAIWDIFDGQTTNPSGGATALEQAAFTAATTGGYVASNVSVFTPDGPGPNPKDASQEFLVVRPAPEIDATAATGALTLLFGGALILGSRRKHQV